MGDATPAAQAFDGAIDLGGQWGLIRAQGADAASFLHGQLTQDVLHLDPGRSRLAGYCSAKGRLLASFVMLRTSADELLLACSADLLPATLRRLSMFVLRAKCRLSDATAELPLAGLAGASAQRRLGDEAAVPAWRCVERGGARLVRLPDGDGVPRWLCIGQADLGLPRLDAAAWGWLEVASGVPRIVAATAEQFVPQMLNLELVGGVDFRKGCYPGQEVVARSQYRGTLKRRMHRFGCAAPLTPGTDVFHNADPGQPAGMVVLAATLPGQGCQALVSLKSAALDDGELRAGPDGPVLTALPLPYDVPAEAES